MRSNLNALLFTSLLTLALSAPAHAQPVSGMPSSPGQTQAYSPGGQPLSPLPKRIDNFVEQRLSQLGVPGYSLCVVRKGEVILQKGYGFADLESRTPVTPETTFGLASITKTFTAMALLVLVDRGLINLDDPLSKHLPDIPKEWQPITIRQLASMSAGMRKGIPKETPWPQEFETLKQMPLLFPPGSDTTYSNPSYRTLGTVIEKVTKSKYMDVLADFVLLPLAMNNTGTTDDPKGPQSNAYRRNVQTGQIARIRYKDTRISFSAGMLSSNTPDLVKYTQALLDRDILSPPAYKTLFFERYPPPSGKPGTWAFGWGRNAIAGQLCLAMNGGDPGVASTILMLPESRLVVIGLANMHAKGVYQLPRQVARMVLESDEIERAEQSAPGGSEGTEPMDAGEGTEASNE